MDLPATSIDATSLVKERKRVGRKIHQCPKCKIELSQRVHRGALIKALLPHIVKRYLCTGCLHRYYVIA